MRNTHFERLEKKAETILKKEFKALPYHNVNHATHTAREAEKLFRLEKKFAQTQGKKFQLERSDFALLRLTAKCHDLVQGLKKPGENEKQSAAWMIKELEGVLSEEEKEMVTVAILGTQTLSKDNQLVQAVLEYKKHLSARVVLFAELLADSDLSSLGSPWKTYWASMSAFFKEIHPKGSLHDWALYLEAQSGILRRFHYKTEAGQKRYKYLRSNAKKIETLLKNEEKVKKSGEHIYK